MSGFIKTITGFVSNLWGRRSTKKDEQAQQKTIPIAEKSQSKKSGKAKSVSFGRNRVALFYKDDPADSIIRNEITLRELVKMELARYQKRMCNQEKDYSDRDIDQYWSDEMQQPMETVSNYQPPIPDRFELITMTVEEDIEKAIRCKNNKKVKLDTAEPRNSIMEPKRKIDNLNRSVPVVHRSYLSGDSSPDQPLRRRPRRANREYRYCSPANQLPILSELEEVEGQPLELPTQRNTLCSSCQKQGAVIAFPMCQHLFHENCCEKECLICKDVPNDDIH